MRMLDDAMVSVTTGEVSPIPAGIVYCGVIAACIDAFDLRRAAEWTEVLTDWCEQQPDLVPFRGQCLVHRSEVLQAHGSWPDAAKAAEDALRYLSEPGHPSVGAACTRSASCIDSAASSPRPACLPRSKPLRTRAVARVRAAAPRSRTGRGGRGLHPTGGRRDARPAHPSGDARRGGGGAARLRRCGGRPGHVGRAGSTHRGQVAPYVRAMAAYCSGSVLLAEEMPWARSSSFAGGRCLARLEPPYDTARASVQIARACRSLSDHDAADRQLETALERSNTSGRGPSWPGRGGWHDPGRRTGALTARQCDVLRAVSTGKSNREVAAALGISEHTVARHLQNIFTKLDLPSRAAATTYAHEHGLL